VTVGRARDPKLFFVSQAKGLAFGIGHLAVDDKPIASLIHERQSEIDVLAQSALDPTGLEEEGETSGV